MEVLLLTKRREPPDAACRGPCPLDSWTGLLEYCCWVLVLILVALWLAGGAGPEIELGIVTQVSFLVSASLGALILAMMDIFVTLPTGRAAVLTLILWQGWPLLLAYAFWTLLFLCMPVSLASLARRLSCQSRYRKQARDHEHSYLKCEAAANCPWPCRFHVLLAVLVAFAEAIVGFVWFANRSGGLNEHWPTILMLMFAMLLIPSLGPLVPMLLWRGLAVAWRRRPT